VGRGAAASLCLLVTHGKLADDARERIETMVRTDDGFAIAEKDLDLRGPGDFFGTRQSGLPLLRVADLLRDRDLLEIARREAFALVRRGPEATASLRKLLVDGGWERRFGLARVG
jgi:ATP-dependent DNA helicase RecG